METKTHWKKAFKSDYLSSSDVDGLDLNLTIKEVKYQECMTQSGKKFCNVAHFTDSKTKPMILNVTNSKVIKSFAGNKTHLEDWKNINVTIYVDGNVRFGSETTEGLRIRKVQTKTKKQLTTLTDDKFNDAVKFLKGGKTIINLKTFYTISADMEQKLVNAMLDEA